MERAKEIKPYVEPVIIDPTAEELHSCIYCQKALKKSDSNCVEVSKGKFAHKECIEKEAKREKTDEEKLNEYIMHLFGTTYVPPRIKRQITNFRNEYKYSYSGIQKALIYFYEVKHNSLENANGGIGIVPYIYKDAYMYYYALWQAEQKNLPKLAEIESYIPKQEVIEIPIPERKLNKRQLFTFLDEVEEENNIGE